MQAKYKKNNNVLNNRHDKKYLLLAAAILYVIIYVSFYPTFYTFVDENEYLRGSYLLSQGRLKVTDTHQQYRYLPFTDPCDNDKPCSSSLHYSNKYPPGMFLLLLPFTIISWKLGFLLSLAAHLASFYLLIKILRKLSINEYFALLYLFFPGIVFFSRTMMSELPSIFFILLSFYFYIKEDKKDKVLAGIFTGVAILIRYTNALFFIALSLAMFLRWLKETRWRLNSRNLFNKQAVDYLLFLISFVPFLILLLLYNKHAYNGFLNFGYTLQNSGVSVVLFKSFYTYFKYIGALLIVYPLMLLAPIYYRGKYKLEIILSTYLFLIVFGMQDLFHYDVIKNLIIGTRYMFPVLPLMLIAYFGVLENVINWLINRYNSKFNLKTYLSPNKCILFIVMILFLLSITITKAQYGYSSNLGSIKDTIYNSVPPDSIIYGELFEMMFINEHFGNLNAMTTAYAPFLQNMGKSDKKEFIIDISSKYDDDLLKNPRDIVKMSTSKSHILMVINDTHAKLYAENKIKGNTVRFYEIGKLSNQIT
ncbi:glycosyltransferase family 39 protein [Candidatus Woesearchaeota archaeon]|nr:glycosyltransferase family 39 protein [Candidatus Woesearchaeota archaeon]